MLEAWLRLSLELRLDSLRLGEHVARSETLRELLLRPVESGGLVALHGLLMLHGDRGRLSRLLSRDIALGIRRLLQLLGLERIEDLVRAGHSSSAWSAMASRPSMSAPVKEVLSLIRTGIGTRVGVHLISHLLDPFCGMEALAEVLLGVVLWWGVWLQVSMGSISGEHVLALHLRRPGNKLHVGLWLLKSLLALELHRFRCCQVRRLCASATPASASVSLGAQSWWVLLSRHLDIVATIVELAGGRDILHARV